MSMDSETTAAVTTGPIREGERATVLDVLRGVALLGILTINIQLFAAPDMPLGYGDPVLTPDRWALFLIYWLVQAKFYSLFSFLYGVGFAVQMRNAKQGDSKATVRFFRRSAVLAGFGLLHIIFLWEGDILLAYALTGLLLPAFWNVSDKAIKRWIACLIGIPFLLAVCLFCLVNLARLIPAVDATFLKIEADILKGLLEQSASEIEKLRTTPYFTAMGRRVLHYLSTYVIANAITTPAFLSMFLTGLLVGRRQIPMRLEENRRLIRKTAIICLSLGMPVALFTSIMVLKAPIVSSFPTQFFNNYFAGPILGIGYAACLALVVMKLGSSSPLLKPIAATGRMGFTNYLMQSLVCTTFFAGYGLGFAGRFGPLQLVGLAVALFLCQMVLSTIWLHFFEFGPMEWLWRTLTYGKTPPLLRQATAPTQANASIELPSNESPIDGGPTHRL